MPPVNSKSVRKMDQDQESQSKKRKAVSQSSNSGKYKQNRKNFITEANVHLYKIDCPVSSVYDIHHIKLTGTACKYRHNWYSWPAKIYPNFTIISDSICKQVNETNHILVQSVPGAEIQDIFWCIRFGEIKVKNFRIIVLHIGTNNLLKDTHSKILYYMERLILYVQSFCPKVKVAISSIIQRPRDFGWREKKRRLINVQLERLAGFNKCYFLKSWRPFKKREVTQNIKKYFAADGLHLKPAGSELLKKYFVGSIIRLDGSKEPPEYNLFK